MGIEQTIDDALQLSMNLRSYIPADSSGIIAV